LGHTRDTHLKKQIKKAKKSRGKGQLSLTPRLLKRRGIGKSGSIAGRIENRRETYSIQDGERGRRYESGRCMMCAKREGGTRSIVEGRRQW